MRKQFDRNDRSNIAWLDAAVKEKVHRLCHELEADLIQKGLIFLLIELPSFEYPVVFREEGMRPTELGLTTPDAQAAVYQIMPDPEMSVDTNPVEAKHRSTAYKRQRRRGRDVQPNAAERKQITVRLRLQEREREREQHAAIPSHYLPFQKILRYPPSRQLSQDDRDFLWNFRTYLKNDKKVHAIYILLLLLLLLHIHTCTHY